MTTVQNAPTEARVEGKGTLPPAALVQALTAILPHSALPAVNLPPLTGIKLEAADGKISLAATDRYTVGTWTMDWEGGDVDAFLPLPSAKELLAYCKAVPKASQGYSCLALTFEDRVVEVFDFTRRSQLPLGEPEHFPRWRALMPDYTPGALPDGIQFVGINPAHLARFEKAAERGIPLTMVFAGSPHRPILVKTGEHFRGLIMPVRLTGTPWENAA